MLHRLGGGRIHDAGIVATMLAHGIGAIVTQNTRDFAGFREIRPLALPEIGNGADRERASFDERR